MLCCGNRVFTSGVARVTKIIVAGHKQYAVYLTDEAKTVFTNSGSFSGFNFEKTGNNAVAIGKETNVKRTEKLAARHNSYPSSRFQRNQPLVKVAKTSGKTPIAMLDSCKW